MSTINSNDTRANPFRIPARRGRGQCRQCGQQVRLGNDIDGPEKEGLCDECRLYLDQPELDYHLWTWRSAGQGRCMVQCRIRKPEDTLHAPHQVTMHRKDGRPDADGKLKPPGKPGERWQ